jgi:hypothetical protein
MGRGRNGSKTPYMINRVDSQPPNTVMTVKTLTEQRLETMHANAFKN